ncbi:MAG: hypothetical protein ACOYMN_02085 [Roseimicrobium sp.]
MFAFFAHYLSTFYLFWTKVRPWWQRVFPWVLVLLPAAALLRLITLHAVNIPFLDDWMFVQMDAKAARGELTWQDFFVVQMEHRMAFVRGVIMAFHKLFPADYTKQMYFSWVLLLGTAVNVFLLVRRTTGARLAEFWPVMVLASVTIFTPVQHQIVLWAMMFQVAAPAFFLSTSLNMQLTPRPLWLRFSAGILCALCATLSFATGILLWVVPLPLLFLPGVIRGRAARWVYVGLWLAVFAVTMGLYFHDLKNETDPQFSYKQGEQETMGRNIAAFVKQPVPAAAFVLRLLGCHLARGTALPVMDVSLVIGATSVILWVAAALYWWRRFEDLLLRRALLPWLLFGGYSIGAAGLIALGRVWATNTGENAITARYVIHAVPLTVSLIVLAWLIARDVWRLLPAWRLQAVQIPTVAAFVLMALQAISWAHGGNIMGVWASSRLRGAANVLFYNTINNTEGDIAGNRHLARLANELQLLDPPMLQDRRLENFEIQTDLLSANTAAFESLSIKSQDGGSGGEARFGVARGYACLPGRRRVADAVLFAYRSPESGWQIFHVAQVAGLPIYLMPALARDMQFIHVPGGEMGRGGIAGFEARFDLVQLPPGEHEIMAWAYDHRERSVRPMAGFFKVNTNGGKVTILGRSQQTAVLDALRLKTLSRQ